jgi:hypothetical protein
MVCVAFWQVQMVWDIQKASRNLCHRQLSWFRDEPLFKWMDAAQEPEQVADAILAELSNDTHTGTRHLLMSRWSAHGYMLPSLSALCASSVT